MNFLKGILIVLIVFTLFLFGLFIYDTIKYKCIKGHYEQQVIYDVALKMPMTENVFICDEKMLWKDYNKLNKKCNCK